MIWTDLNLTSIQVTPTSNGHAQHSSNNVSEDDYGFSGYSTNVYANGRQQPQQHKPQQQQQQSDNRWQRKMTAI